MSMSYAQLEGLKLDELRSMAGSRNLKRSGTKQEVIERLVRVRFAWVV